MERLNCHALQRGILDAGGGDYGERGDAVPLGEVGCSVRIAGENRSCDIGSSKLRGLLKRDARQQREPRRFTKASDNLRGKIRVLPRLKLRERLKIGCRTRNATDVGVAKVHPASERRHEPIGLVVCCVCFHSNSTVGSGAKTVRV